MQVQLLCFGRLYLPTDTHNKIQWQITVIKNGDLSLKHAGGFMFGDKLYCVLMLAYINSCKHSAQNE